MPPLLSISLMLWDLLHPMPTIGSGMWQLGPMACTVVRGLGLHVDGFPVGKGFVRCTLDLDRNGMDHAVDAFGIQLSFAKPIARECTLSA